MTRLAKPGQNADAVGADLPELVRPLLRPAAWPHDAGRIELIETHISWIIPVVNALPAIEFAVRMKQFPQDALLECRLEAGELSETDLGQAARLLADFHRSLEGAKAADEFGSPSSIFQPFDDTLADLEEEVATHCPRLTSRVHSLHQRLEPELEARKAGGFVRECHGDLHLRNLLKLDGRIVAFDCLEFSAALRWIDVMNEAAFLFMDLEAHRARPLAYRFVNDYLQQTGDYPGLSLLDYYAAYHALVRAKVARLAAGDEALDSREVRDYLTLGNRLLRESRGLLVLTHGFSGSGKTTLTEPLIGRLPAIRIRSDLERKRLARLAPHARTHAEFGEGIYSGAGTRRTYRRLLSLALPALRAGLCVIVDAAFLKRWQRALFRRAANASNLEIVLLDFIAPESVLRDRLREREAAGATVSDALIAPAARRRWYAICIRSTEALPQDAAMSIPYPPRRRRRRTSGAAPTRPAWALVAATLVFTACATPPELVPAPGAERVSPQGKIAAASGAGVTVTVDPDAWRGNVRIGSAVTPMHVKIENASDRKLRIRYSDFAMVAENGERYAALPPYDIRGTVADALPARRYSPVDRLGFTYDGFHVAPFYRSMYPSLSVWDAHRFYFDPLYYEHYYPYWARNRVELPTAEMLRFALPEGVLDEGGVLAGFLYFEPIESNLSPPEVTFRADVVDIVTGEMVATLEVPFVIQDEE